MCLVCSWKTELWAIWIELWLSQYIGIGWERETPISVSNQRNQTIYLVVDAITRYSVSVEDWETIDCFLLFQEIRESPKKIQNPVTDLRSWDHYHDQHQSMHVTSRKRWMKVKDSEKLYPEDIAKYEEQLPSEQ